MISQNKLTVDSTTPNLRREFLTCLGTMFFFATGGGAYLLLIVGYMEKRSLPVSEIGAVMSLLSIVEGAVCLLIGHFYKGIWTRQILIGGLFFNGLAAWMMAFQPLGLPLWSSAAFCGAGFGIFTVVMYVAALQRRPPALGLGLAVGLYTACIAAGNGIGALVSGWLTDQHGFAVSFSFAIVTYGVGLLGVLMLSGKPIPAHAQPEGGLSSLAAAQTVKNSVWMLALLSAFTLSSINMVFDILFPVYMLRVGMSFTMVGTLSGTKMVLAALVRPFTGALMLKFKPQRMNNVTLAGLGLGTMLIPAAGMGFGLPLVIALLGVTFGSIRTTSATLAVINEHDPQVISRRISYYNTCLTLGQVVSPWLTGRIADRTGVTTALVAVPLCFLSIYIVGVMLMPRIAASFPTVKRSILPL